MDNVVPLLNDDEIRARRYELEKRQIDAMTEVMDHSANIAACLLNIVGALRTLEAMRLNPVDSINQPITLLQQDVEEVFPFR